MTSRRIVLATAPLLAACCLAATPGLAQTRARAGISAGLPFPLAPGNRWTYARQGPGVDETWQVTATAPPGPAASSPHVALSGYFPGPARRIHADRAGTVVELDPAGGRPSLWYSLGAPVGAAWELRLAELPATDPGGGCVSGSKLVLAARDETVTVPAGQFHHVIRVDSTPPCADAGITSEWFAPGVGLIRRVESSFAGAVVSELVAAVVSGRPLPAAAYETSLALESPLLVNDLMPRVGETVTPTLRGVYRIANHTAVPLELAFSGCVSATVNVVTADGEAVLSGRADDGGCCACDVVHRLVLVHDALALPFALELLGAGGGVPADGWYGVEVTLDTLDPEPLRPAARSRLELQTVY